VNWWTGVLSACLTLSFIQRDLLSVLVGPIERDLRLSDTQMGAIQGPAFAMVFSIAGLVFGRCADLWSRRGALILGLAVWTAGILLMVVANSYAALLAGRMLVGAATAAILPVGASLIADMTRGPERGFALGVFLAGASVGDAMSVVVGGGLLAILQTHPLPLVSALGPWRQVVLVPAFAVLALLAVTLFLREPPREHAGAAQPATKPESLGFLVQRWRLFLPYGFAMITASIGGAATNWVPEVLRRSFAMTTAQIATGYGTALICAALVGAALGAVSGRLIHRPREELVVSAAAYLIAAAALVPFAGTNVYACIAGVGVFVALDAISAVLLMSAIQSQTPTSLRGTTAALERFVGVCVGYSVGQPLVGWLAQSWPQARGLGNAMLGVAIPATATAALLLYLASAAVPVPQARANSSARE
jgi:MFS family permease